MPRQAIVCDVEEAAEEAVSLGFPVVVKPLDGNHGNAVSINLKTLDEVRAAFEKAYELSDRVIVEACQPGQDHRILVIDGRVVAVSRRVPGHVVGDGRHTIAELVEITNQDPRRGIGHEKVLTRLEIDDQAERLLALAGLKLDSVPAAGEAVYLRSTGNLSTGGTAIDMTDAIHEDNRLMAERAVKAIGLDVGGVDFVSPDITRSYREVGGAIVEINAAPGFRMHLAPTEGKPRDVAGPVIDMLFPRGTRFRIPIAAITGTNGKTTTTRMVGHILKLSGHKVGMATTDGVYIDGVRTVRGDMTGPWSSQLVLRDPTIDAAVLESARGGIVRSGLGWRKCSVGAVLNVAADHLGLGGIEDIDDLAKVKQIIAEVSEDYCVLNADDERVAAMAEASPAEPIWVTMDHKNERVREHVRGKGKAVVLEEGLNGRMLVLYQGERQIPLLWARQIPATIEGRALHNIQNAMFAAAIAHGLGIGVENIRQGLRTFTTDFFQAPGRLNFYNEHPFRVLLDYAHNAHGMEAVARTVRELAVHGRRIGVIAAPGDRRDEDIAALARAAAPAFDLVLIREDEDLRERQPGEVAARAAPGAARRRFPGRADRPRRLPGGGFRPARDGDGLRRRPGGHLRRQARPHLGADRQLQAQAVGGEARGAGGARGGSPARGAGRGDDGGAGAVGGRSRHQPGHQCPGGEDQPPPHPLPDHPQHLLPLGVHQQHHQIPRPGLRERFLHPFELRAGALDLFRRDAEAAQLVLEDGRHLSRLAAAEHLRQLLDHDAVRQEGEGGADELAEGLVVAVAGLPEHQQAALGGEGARDVEQGGEAVGVVGVVEEDADAVPLEEVGPPGVVLGAVADPPQPGGHRLGRDADRRRHADRRQGVGDVVPGGAAERDRDRLHPGDFNAFTAPRQHQRSILEIDRLAARRQGLPHERVPGVEAEPEDGRAQGRRRGDQLGIVGVEHDPPLRPDGAGDHQLGGGERRQVENPELAQMIGGDVGDQGGGGTIHGEPPPQQSAAGRLQDRHLHPAVAQQRAGAARAGEVAALDQLPPDLDLIRRRHPRHLLRGVHHGREQPDGGGLAVGPGDQQHGDVADLVPVDLLRIGEGADGPGERPLAEAHRGGAVVRQERDPAGRGGIPQGEEAGIRLAGDLVAQPRRRALEVGRLPARELGFDGVPGPIVDLRRGVEGVDGGRDRQAGAAGERPRRDLLAPPADRVEHPPDLRRPGRDRRRGLLRGEGDLDDRPGAVEKEVGAGQAAGVEAIHGRGSLADRSDGAMAGEAAPELPPCLPDLPECLEALPVIFRLQM